MRMPGENKPSVLHVYKDYWPPVVGGMEKCIHWIADQTKDDYQVRVLVASRSRRLEDEVIDGVRVVRVPCYGRALSSPLAPGFVSWMRRLDSDILHFHAPNPVGELACLLARPRGRVVVTYQSDIVRQRLTGALYRPMQKAFLARAHAIMASSQRYLDTSETLAPHRSRCRVVPLGIPIENYRETDASRAFAKSIAWRFGEDGIRIVFLGVQRYYKGLHFLIQALADLPENVTLLIGGEGPEQGVLKRVAQVADLSERVKFLGGLDDAEAVGLLHAGDIFCMPSHLRAEAFGLAQVEAMACGLPVVSCDLPTGVPEVNRDGESGLIVPPGNVAALRDALARLIEDEPLRRRLGESAKARAQEHYSAERMGENIKRVYEGVMGGEGMQSEK